jgi:hypothetical protein
MLANPQYYDYLHFLDFHDNGSVELVDGAGQVINTVARGRYQTHDLAHSIAEVTFFELIEVDPYQEYRKVSTLPNFTVQVTKEEGVFPFVREVVWNIEDTATLPALLYRTRYVYVFDPLAFGRSNQLNNLYYLVEQKELVDSVRYYYPRDSGQELTVQDLLESGIPQELFWPST